MTMHLDAAWIMAVFCVAMRVGVLLMLTPIFANLSGLVTVRVLLTLALSVVLVSGLQVAPGKPTLEVGDIMLAAMSELAIGATLAFGVFSAFGAFAVAGKILDIQTGFGIGNVYDPVTRAGAPLFATLLDMVAVVVFYAMDAHLALMRGIAFSLHEIAPGAGLAGFAPEPVIRQFGLMFSLGVAMVVPVMLCLLLVETGLAVVSRVLPQMNVFVVGVPVKIVAGLAIFAMTLGSAAGTMGRVYASIFTFWEQVLS